MSSPTRHRTHTGLVPRPRTPVDPPAARHVPQQEPTGERPGMFDRHGWLIPLCGIACVLAVFIAMILLTWGAGGGSPFTR